jgi:hypothetical protein
MRIIRNGRILVSTLIKAFVSGRAAFLVNSLICILALTAVLGAADASAVVPVEVLKTRDLVSPAAAEIAKAVRARVNLTDYREVRVQLIRDEHGKPDHYLVYLHSKTLHRVDFAKLALDAKSNVVSVQYGYELGESDIKQQGVTPVTVVRPEPAEAKIIKPAFAG